jgi:hypothetical protein
MEEAVRLSLPTTGLPRSPSLLTDHNRRPSLSLNLKVPTLAWSSILHYRDELPKLLNRLPGPKTLLYYLGKDEVLQELELKVCNPTSFIWRILTANGRILHRSRSEPRAWERPEPLQCITKIAPVCR